jgi:hypothetical protein
MAQTTPSVVGKAVYKYSHAGTRCFSGGAIDDISGMDYVSSLILFYLNRERHEYEG